jgi:hypothetical protein
VVWIALGFLPEALTLIYGKPGMFSTDKVTLILTTL